MKIRVEYDDIIFSRRTPYKCPIALAIRRTDPNIAICDVYRDEIHIRFWTKEHKVSELWCKTPGKATEFMKIYDTKYKHVNPWGRNTQKYMLRIDPHPLKPFEFELNYNES